MTSSDGRMLSTSELEGKLQRSSAKARQAEEHLSQSSKTLQAVKSGVGNIFHRLGCASQATSELLGNVGVTESNLMQYLVISCSCITRTDQSWAKRRRMRI